MVSKILDLCLAVPGWLIFSTEKSTSARRGQTSFATVFEASAADILVILFGRATSDRKHKYGLAPAFARRCSQTIRVDL